MSLKVVQEENRGTQHVQWFRKGIYAKTVLGRFLQCMHRGMLVYIEGHDEPWSWDLVEGIMHHKVMEEFHKQGNKLDDPLPVMMGEFLRTKDRLPEDDYDDKLVAARVKSQVFLKQYAAKFWTEMRLKPLSIEETFGMDTPVKFGDVHIAGHLDLKADQDGAITLVDYKFVGSRSQWRREKKFDLGMELYVHGVGAERSAILCFVKDLKSGPKMDPLRYVTHTKGTHEAAVHMVNQVHEQIQKGNFPTTTEIGTGLCHPKYCTFFGTGLCPATQGLKREDYLPKG